jgi:hypothetical protein
VDGCGWWMGWVAEAKRPRSLQSDEIQKERTWDVIYWPGIWSHRTLQIGDKEGGSPVASAR